MPPPPLESLEEEGSSAHLQTVSHCSVALRDPGLLPLGWAADQGALLRQLTGTKSDVGLSNKTLALYEVLRL